MADFWSIPTVQAGLSLLVLCVLIAVAFWLVSRFRDRATDDRLPTEELLAKFEEMHREGDISGKEFRTIKASMDRRRSGVISDREGTA